VVDTFLFFFFQAEDGIRDFHVTGVQTCALPISLGVPIIASGGAGTADHLRAAVGAGAGAVLAASIFHQDRLPLRAAKAYLQAARSEERRVGKECRCRWAPCRVSVNTQQRRE